MSTSGGKSTAANGYPNLAYPSGSYFFPVSGNAASTSAVLGDDAFKFSPMFLPACTIKSIGAEVVTAGTAGCTFRLGGFFDNGGGQPGNLCLDAGTIPGDVIASAEVVLTTPLPIVEGWYWLGGVIQGEPALQPVMRINSGPTLLPLIGPSLPAANTTRMGYTIAGVTGALPAIAAGFLVSNLCPRIFLSIE